ncbi:hypothetical protein [Nannocystis pusilla]|uniref:hypothetical protein n=1 Tax=Nannocystis pusilla TaxID=889268 RepID=UPI003DA5F70B
MRTRIDILAPEVRADPYPHYARLRRDHPVCLAEPGGMWLVSRHDDIMTVLRDPARFSSQGFRAVWEPSWIGYNPLARSILAIDGPAHARLRALASRSLGPRAVARLEPAIRARAERLLSDLEGDVRARHRLRRPAARLRHRHPARPRRIARPPVQAVGRRLPLRHPRAARTSPTPSASRPPSPSCPPICAP